MKKGQLLMISGVMLVIAAVVVAAQNIVIGGDRRTMERLKGDFDTQPEKIFLAIGNEFFKNGMDTQAADAYQTSLAHNPLYAKAMNNFGVVAIKRNDAYTAEYWFTQAIAQDSDSALFYYNRGILAFNRGDLKSAAADFSEVTRLEENVHAWFDLGVVEGLIARDTGHRDSLVRASEAFKHALALDPDFAHAKQNLLIVEDILKAS